MTALWRERKSRRVFHGRGESMESEQTCSNLSFARCPRTGRRQSQILSGAPSVAYSGRAVSYFTSRSATLVFTWDTPFSFTSTLCRKSW